jgi:surface protein
MGYMFWRCRSFAQNIDNWDVRNVKNMRYAFEECRTQPNWYKKEK